MPDRRIRPQVSRTNMPPYSIYPFTTSNLPLLMTYFTRPFKTELNQGEFCPKDGLDLRSYRHSSCGSNMVREDNVDFSFRSTLAGPSVILLISKGHPNSPSSSMRPLRKPGKPTIPNEARSNSICFESRS